MKSEAKNKTSILKKANYQSLVQSIGGLIQSARVRVIQTINTEMVNLYWEIGRHIVEYEQGGSDRAKYGEGLIERLSIDLTQQFSKGFSARNLKNMRMLYKTFPIRQPLVAELEDDIPFQVLPDGLSWVHLLQIMRVEEPLARHFYIKQCQLERWSKRELERQINSMLFERIALSKDKKGVLEMAKKGHQIFKPEDLLKDPYVFEFLNLSEDHKLSESDLEQKLIGHLKQFLLELGQGFCFVAQQKRITIDSDHNYIDLVFYHRILKCFVLIDLKMRAFKPSNAGQMNFYINYMKDNENAPEDNPPIGILLCLDRNELYVKYATAGMANLILTGRFKLTLPSPELLKAEVKKVLEG
jgi:predicted nuclease of restriction endonuclease-like (RecB) superfamily